MIDPKTGPKPIWDLRRSTRRYLARYAVAFWRLQESSGAGEPHVPPSLEHLHGGVRRKTLARHEARRVSRADLYGLDARATALAVDLGAMLQSGAHAHAVMLAGHPSVVDSMGIKPPAPCGFLRWGTGVGHTPDGVPVIACHWEKIAGGCWIVFWTDNSIAAEIMRSRDSKSSFFTQEYLRLTGPLLYDHSVLIRPAFPRAVEPPQPEPPDPAVQDVTDSTVDSGTVLVYTLLGTWQAMATTGATVRTLHEPSLAEAMADRRADVVPRNVTCVSAEEGAVETLRDLLAAQAEEGGGN